MPLLDFMGGRRSVVIGGRLFRVSRPTFETVLVLLARFGREVAAAAEVLAKTGGHVEAVIPLFASDPERFGEVVETCVAGDGPPASWPLAELAVAVLRDCDVDRIVAEFRSVPVSADADDLVPDPGLSDVAYCSLAAHFGVSPMELSRWPFEAYLSARDAVERIATRDLEPKKYLRLPVDETGVGVM